MINLNFNNWLRLFFVLLFFYPHKSFSGIDSTIFSQDSIRYFIENDSIKVGFDKRMGGVVSYFVRKSNGINIINNHDAGRQAGFETRIYPDNQSTWKPYANAKYLSDIYPDSGGASREWNGLPQGSFYNQNFNDSKHLGGLPDSLFFDEKRGILYINAKLWEWGFINQENDEYKIIDAGAYNEYWVSLEGIAAHFTVKQVRDIPYFVSNSNVGVSLNVFINLNYQFTNKWQAYNGTQPYTNRSVQTRTNFFPNQDNYWDKPTENWVAMTNQNNFGMGIYADATKFGFLFAEKQFLDECPKPLLTCPDEQKYSFGTFSFSTYGFPCGEPCTTLNNSTTLNFSFLAGNINEIRQFAYQKHANPCDNIITLSSKNDDLMTNATKKAKLLIHANNKIMNATSTFQSGSTITLNPGFKVQSGAVFTAEINPNPCQ